MKRKISLILVVILLISSTVYAEVIVTNDISLGEEIVLEEAGKREISVDMILKAIDEIDYEFSMDYRIYVTNYKANGGKLLGLAYDTNDIYLFVSNTQKNLQNWIMVQDQYDAVVVHELGHLVYYSMTDKQRFEYFELREIPEDWGDSIRTRYANRPSEIFAEDFRILFGGEKAREKYHINRRLKPPNEVKGLKEFIEKLQ